MTRLYLALHTPRVIYTARVNQAFYTTDLLAQVKYDGGSGTLADVLPGMTVYIGSSAGAYDRGFCRVRKTPTSNTLYIGETSEIAWADNLYLTVVDEFRPWQKAARISDGVIYMDYDVAYSDQHLYPDPVVVMGGQRAAWLTNGSAVFNVSAAGSWVPGGGSVYSYLWSVAPEAGASISNTGVAAPTVTITQAGTYRLGCRVMSLNGRIHTGYRYIFVFDANHPPVENFSLEACVGEVDSGGWQFSGQIKGLPTLLPGGLTVLFDESNTVRASGYLAAETLTLDPEQDAVNFEARGLHWQLAQMPNFPTGIEQSVGTPANWTEMQSLTVDKAAWHLLHWRSNLTQIADYISNGDARLAASLEAPAGSLWAQLAAYAESILAAPVCDHNQAVRVQIPLNLTPVANRSGITTVQTVTAAQRAKTLKAEHRRLAQAAQVDLSGVSVDAANQGAAYFALANGRVPKRVGSLDRRERLLLGAQTQANELAGLLLARANNPVGEFTLELAEGQGLGFDIAPLQYGQVDLPGLYSGKFAVLGVEVHYNPHSGALSVTLRAEAETGVEQAVDGDAPPPDPETGVAAADHNLPEPFKFPPLPAFPPLPLPPLPTSGQPRYAILFTDNYGLWWTDKFSEASPRWKSLNANFTQAELANLLYLTCNRGGRFYCGNTKRIWSWSIGEAPRLLAGEEFFNPLNSSYVIWGLAANPYASDSVAALVSTSGDRSAVKIFTGGIGGLQPKGVLDGAMWGSAGISYAGGKWLITYPGTILVNFYSARWSLDGNTREFIGQGGAGGLLPNLYANPNAGHIAAGRFGGDVVFLPYIGTSRNSKLAANGETETYIAALNFDACIAADPTGTYIMAAYGNTPKRSNDGGVTWGNISNNAWWGGANGWVKQDTFIWATAAYEDPSYRAAAIRYTEDFGATWSDKTGDLLSYMPGENILARKIIVFD